MKFLCFISWRTSPIRLRYLKPLECLYYYFHWRIKYLLIFKHPVFQWDRVNGLAKMVITWPCQISYGWRWAILNTYWDAGSLRNSWITSSSIQFFYFLITSRSHNVFFICFRNIHLICRYGPGAYWLFLFGL